MTKARKLKICDWSLLIATLLMLASSVQLEAFLPAVRWVWVHIALGCAFFALIVWHIYLHFGWKVWFRKFRKQKSPVTRWLALFGLLTVVSAAVVMVHWVVSFAHSPIGGVHGKIGFVFLILAVGHTIKRLRFFSK